MSRTRVELETSGLKFQHSNWQNVDISSYRSQVQFLAWTFKKMFFLYIFSHKGLVKASEFFLSFTYFSKLPSYLFNITIGKQKMGKQKDYYRPKKAGKRFSISPLELRGKKQNNTQFEGQESSSAYQPKTSPMKVIQGKQIHVLGYHCVLGKC